MYCTKCGSKNNDGAQFCINCGERILSGTDIQTSSPPPEAAYPQAQQPAYNQQYTIRPAAVTSKSAKRRLVIWIAAAVAAVAVIVVVLLFALNTAPVYGNTAMNIDNGGIAAGDNGWIYYCNSSDNFSLYKIRTDGTGKTKLNSEASDNINVAGGWVYYRVFMGDHPKSICRVRTDGTGSETIKSEARASHLLVCGEWIFYIAPAPDSPPKERYLYKLRTEGVEEYKFDAQPSAETFTVYGGWVYYRDKTDNYKIRIDGTGKEKLNGDYDYQTLSDGWIYYYNGGGLSKMRIDGTETEKLNDDFAININVADGWVYYQILTDNNSIYRVRTDGTGRAKLNDVSSNLINVAGDWIYYESGGFYRMKTDGSENQQVE